MRKGKRNLLLTRGLSTAVLRKHGLKRARGVMQKRRASIPSKGWKVSFKSAFKKREKKAK